MRSAVYQDLFNPKISVRSQRQASVADCPVVDVSTCDDVDAGSATWSGVGKSGEASRNAVARSRAGQHSLACPFHSTTKNNTGTKHEGTKHETVPLTTGHGLYSIYGRLARGSSLGRDRQSWRPRLTRAGHTTDAEKETSQNIPQMSNAWFLAPYPPEISHYPHIPTDISDPDGYIRLPAASLTSLSSESPHASSTRPQTASASARPGGP